MNWISVKERLPEVRTWVLGYWGNQSICMIDERGLWIHWCIDNLGVTPSHWMPLPEPPRE